MLNLNIFEHGIEIKSGLISEQAIEAIISEVGSASEEMPKYGVRNAEKKFPSILELMDSELVQAYAHSILGKAPSVVRVIFFDKTPEKNWLVAWHQDKTISLNKKFEKEGWEPWTIKDDIHHVQPPLEVLNQMVTFRIHLDSADENNGCLNVISQSHQAGILKQKQVDEIVAKEDVLLCIVDAGDTVVMRPHLLHASSKAVTPQHRRVVHIEFSGYELPCGVSWA